jgi:hypothetical protein
MRCMLLVVPFPTSIHIEGDLFVRGEKRLHNLRVYA